MDEDIVVCGNYPKVQCDRENPCPSYTPHKRGGGAEHPCYYPRLKKVLDELKRK